MLVDNHHQNEVAVYNREHTHAPEFIMYRRYYKLLIVSQCCICIIILHWWLTHHSFYNTTLFNLHDWPVDRDITNSLHFRLFKMRCTRQKTTTLKQQPLFISDCRLLDATWIWVRRNSALTLWPQTAALFRILAMAAIPGSIIIRRYYNAGDPS